MLVLTRKKGESIRIGDDIEIKILSIDNDGVKIGVVAPRSLAVHRQEVFEAIQLTNLESATLLKADIKALKQAMFSDKASDNK